MAVQFDTPPATPVRRTPQTDVIIVAAAAGLAVAHVVRLLRPGQASTSWMPTAPPRKRGPGG